MTSASTHFTRAFKTVNYCLIYHTFLALTLWTRCVRISYKAFDLFFSRMNNYLILMLASHEGILRSVVNRIVLMICLFSRINFPLIVLLGIHRRKRYGLPLTRFHSSVLCQNCMCVKGIVLILPGSTEVFMSIVDVPRA